MIDKDKLILELKNQLKIEQDLLDQAVDYIHTEEFEPIGDGNPYYKCPECDVTNVQVTSTGHYKGCNNGKAAKLRESIRQTQNSRKLD